MKHRITFILCSEQLPKASGTYFCILENGGVLDIIYSSVYKVFNTCDWCDEEYANTYKLPVVAWAKIPKWVKEVI